MRIGAVGLGAGTIAAWGDTGDAMRFFEINPAAETYARQYFTFLSDSRATVDVVLGDARLSLERELRDGIGSRAYDVLAIDAFTGDAIPVHLLTREAFALYFAVMNPDGVLALHVSNRYLELVPVVRGLARELGLEALEIEQDQDAWNAVEASTWMLVTRDGAFIERVQESAQPAEADARSLIWTDTFSSVIRVLKR
jgi:spermidine synthase